MTPLTLANPEPSEVYSFDYKTILLDQPKKLNLPIVKKPEPRSLPSNSPVSVQTKVYTTSGVEQWRSLVSKYDWPVEQALAIMKCESGGRADARGDGHLTYMVGGVEYGASYGLMQIRHLPGRPAPSKLVDAKFNLDYAYGMFKSSGWAPWSCKRVL